VLVTLYPSMKPDDNLHVVADERANRPTLDALAPPTSTPSSPLVGHREIAGVGGRDRECRQLVSRRHHAHGLLGDPITPANLAEQPDLAWRESWSEYSVGAIRGSFHSTWRKSPPVPSCRALRCNRIAAMSDCAVEAWAEKVLQHRFPRDQDFSICACPGRI